MNELAAEHVPSCSLPSIRTIDSRNGSDDVMISFVLLWDRGCGKTKGTAPEFRHRMAVELFEMGTHLSPTTILARRIHERLEDLKEVRKLQFCERRRCGIKADAAGINGRFSRKVIENLFDRRHDLAADITLWELHFSNQMLRISGRGLTKGRPVFVSRFSTSSFSSSITMSSSSSASGGGALP